MGLRSTLDGSCDYLKSCYSNMKFEAYAVALYLKGGTDVTDEKKERVEHTWYNRTCNWLPFDKIMDKYKEYGFQIEELYKDQLGPVGTLKTQEQPYRLYLENLVKLPKSIMLVSREEGEKGTGDYNAYETFRVTDYLDHEICEIRNRGGYHTVYVYED